MNNLIEIRWHWNEGKQMFVVEPGTVKLLIGASSEDIRLEGKIRL